MTSNSGIGAFLILRSLQVLLSLLAREQEATPKPSVTKATLKTTVPKRENGEINGEQCNQALINDQLISESG